MRSCPTFRATIAIVTTLATTALAAGGPPASESTVGANPSPSFDGDDSGTRRLLILCGHPGDEAHRALYAETVDRLRETLTTRYDFDADAVMILFGTDEMFGDGGPVPQQAAACTRESVTEVTAELQGVLDPADALWVVVMGHAHFDGRYSHFNLAGPDMQQEEFAGCCEGLACRELVFWITIPASGFYIRPLSADGRVVISATEADREINETIFPHALADVLAEPSGADEWDADMDGRSTLFDLYLSITRRIAQTYLDDNSLLTEHARLEDNGDGRGTEVQRGYLPEELGGRLGEGDSPRPRTGSEEGAAAAGIPFERPVEAESADPEAEDAAPDDSDPAVAETGDATS